VVVVNNRSNDMSVFLGRGDGSLGDAKASGLETMTGPSFLVLVDLNGDARLDAVVADGGMHTVSVSFGNGDGTFQWPWRLTVGDTIQSLAVADVNRDGKLDIAVTSRFHHRRMGARVFGSDLRQVTACATVTNLRCGTRRRATKGATFKSP